MAKASSDDILESGWGFWNPIYLVGGSNSMSGGAKRISRSGAMLKQLTPDFKNLRHLESVLLPNANATCFGIFAIAPLEGPLVACKNITRI
ncbi:hypothetical protein HanXRQr2_Chr14g0660671 [Helianthus annuus]|uniref:Uncharacterized protein n=1 Tax=Helianthus annuus TaxID=4232 RepID=A0A9K3EBR0_HELAN|nr:hypothetical protein HanXRQr2_Chr14g0660671 [Helianthus annuus]KAJ0841746.1 hypothetical protein HanPSC8_Chr14g0633871 [Helianthus annuus]